MNYFQEVINPLVDYVHNTSLITFYNEFPKFIDNGGELSPFEFKMLVGEAIIDDFVKLRVFPNKFILKIYDELKGKLLPKRKLLRKLSFFEGLIAGYELRVIGYQSPFKLFDEGDDFLRISSGIYFFMKGDDFLRCDVGVSPFGLPDYDFKLRTLILPDNHFKELLLTKLSKRF